MFSSLCSVYTIVFLGLLLVVGIGIVLGILLGFSMLAVAVTVIKRLASRGCLVYSVLATDAA